jgi:hypothetical protein
MYPLQGLNEFSMIDEGVNRKRSKVIKGVPAIKRMNWFPKSAVLGVTVFSDDVGGSRKGGKFRGKIQGIGLNFSFKDSFLS